MGALFRYFIYTNLFISLCAVLMVEQTNQLFSLRYPKSLFYAFVFVATLCSYNFHWYLTPMVPSASPRIAWNHRHRKLLLIIYLITLLCSVFLAWQFRMHWFSLGIGVVATFLYSAPKIPHKYFSWLSKIAIGKTLFLTFVWMYVTTALPVLISNTPWTIEHTLFCVSRYALIYAICILFDYRDRDADREQGVKSMITWMSEKTVNRIFLLSLFIFFLSTGALGWMSLTLLTVILLLIPGIIVWGLSNYSKKHFEDYLYYFVLDGLMMLSSLFTIWL